MARRQLHQRRLSPASGSSLGRFFFYTGTVLRHQLRAGVSGRALTFVAKTAQMRANHCTRVIFDSTQKIAQADADMIANPKQRFIYGYEQLVQQEPRVNDGIDHSTLAEMTAEIVSAYVSHNRVAPSEVPNVISSVAARLGNLGQEQAKPAKPEPAVPIRRSISKDHITCLLCGRQHKLLKRHLAVAHSLTPSQYRETFDLKPDYPMTAPSYVQQRSDIAMQIGLGRAKGARGRPRKTTKRREK